MKYLLSILCLIALCMAQELRRPTQDFDAGNNLHLGCNGVNQASSAMPLAYDAAGLATQSALIVGGVTEQQFFETRLFSTWQSTGNTYSALQLNVNIFLRGVDPDQGDGAGCVDYSLDSGVTWTSLSCGGVIPQKTLTVPIPSSQNLAQLRVGACVQYVTNNPFFKPPGHTNLFIYDIWTVGTIGGGGGGQGVGTGSSNGQAHRAIVAVN